MKKTTILFLSLVMCQGLCACKQSASTYAITIPSGFTVKSDDNTTSAVKTWVSPDYEETNYSITAYDVGHSTYVNEEIPSTFEGWSEEEGGNGIAYEEVFFDYKDGDKYEEYTVVAKVTYSAGSVQYDLEKIERSLEDIDLDAEASEDGEKEEFPESIDGCFGRKVMIDKSDRSKAIVAVVESNDVDDVNEFKGVLESFKWN